VVLSAEEPKALVSALERVPAMGRRVEIRGLERAALERAAEKNVYGIDAKFWGYFTKE
jgi:hypothetical protein